MLIGIVYQSFGGVGGAELLLARQADFLREQGHTVRFVTAGLDEAKWARLAAEYDVRVVRKRWTDHLGMPGTHPKLARRMARHARQLRGVDVVFGNGFPGNVVAAQVSATTPAVWYCNEPHRGLHPRASMPHLAARVAATRAEDDTPLLAEARAMFERNAQALARGGQLARQQAMDLASVERLEHVVANSGFSASLVRAVYGRAPGTVIQPTLSLVDAPRRGHGLDSSGLRVLVHSRLEIIKNIETVLRGFAAFRARHPGAHELHVVGTGPDEQRLRDVARACGIDEAARFHGFLDAPALADLYARCEVMALVPADEPFGMVFTEAAQQGLLIVGPDHGGPFEILDGGRLGATVDIFSPEAVGEALVETWRLPNAEVSRRRTQAAAACRQRFGPQATLPKLHALLMKAVDARVQASRVRPRVAVRNILQRARA